MSETHSYLLDLYINIFNKHMFKYFCTNIATKYFRCSNNQALHI